MKKLLAILAACTTCNAEHMESPIKVALGNYEISLVPEFKQLTRSDEETVWEYALRNYDEALFFTSIKYRLSETSALGVRVEEELQHDGAFLFYEYRF